MKILLMRIGNATTAIYTKKTVRTQVKDNFCKRGGDCNAVLLLITRANQLKVVVIMLHITEKQWNIYTHTYINKMNSILFGDICVITTRTRESQEPFREAFSVWQISKNYWLYCLENSTILSSNILCIMLCIEIANYFTRVLNQQKYPADFSALQWRRFTVSNSVLIYKNINREQLSSLEEVGTVYKLYLGKLLASYSKSIV